MISTKLNHQFIIEFFFYQQQKIIITFPRNENIDKTTLSKIDTKRNIIIPSRLFMRNFNRPRNASQSQTPS